MSYKEKLKNPLWQKKRLEVFNRDNFTCQMCGNTELELHVHHLKYTTEPHLSELNDLQTLCCNCHYAVSLLKKEINTVYVKTKLFGESYIIYHRPDGIADLWAIEGETPQLLMSFQKISPMIKYLSENNL